MAAGKKKSRLAADFLILTLYPNWIHTLLRVHYDHSVSKITHVTTDTSFLFHVAIQAIHVQWKEEGAVTWTVGTNIERVLYSDKDIRLRPLQLVNWKTFRKAFTASLSASLHNIAVSVYLSPGCGRIWSRWILRTLSQPAFCTGPEPRDWRCV